MNYSQFLERLEEFGFERQGKSSAFVEIDDWIIGFIGLSGRFQIIETKAFVICARPKSFGYMDKPKSRFHGEPKEYPFKLTIDSYDEKLPYKSQLLQFDHSRLETEGDWSRVFEILVNELPKSLSNIGVSGLVDQLKQIENPGYVEKIWIGELHA